MKQNKIMLLWIQVVLSFGAFILTNGNELVINQEELSDILKEMQSMKSDIVTLSDRQNEETLLRIEGEKRRAQQVTIIATLMESNTKLKETMEKQRLNQEQSISNQSQSINGLQKRIKSNVANVQVLEKKMETLRPDLRNEYSNWGCTFETISLSCATGTILVTNAYFGMYNVCTEACCTPDSSADCTELVSESEPSDWETLQYLCDEKESCAYEYNGRSMEECDPDHTADYMQIFYDCISEIEPVGFTAHHATGAHNYNTGDIIRFGLVQSNFGGHYSALTSSFQCPHRGTYFFTVSFNANYYYDMFIEIVKDDVVLAEAVAEGNIINTIYNHASAFVVVLCEVGETVKARAGGGSYDFLYAWDRSTQFSGYLLYRYD